MSLLFGFILLFLVINTIATKSDFFSPIRFFILIYSFLLSIYFLNLSALQTPWRINTHILIWSSFSLFILGNLITLFLFKIKDSSFSVNFYVIKSKLMENASSIDWKLFRRTINICFTLFIISYFFSYLIVGHIPIFSKSPDIMRLKFIGASLPTNIGLFLGPIGLMLSIELLLFKTCSTKEFLNILLTTIFIGFLYFTIITRVDIFRVMIFSIVLYNYGKSNFSFRHLLITVVLASVIFMSVFLIRIHSEAFETFSNMLKMRLNSKYAFIANFYAYVVNNFWNFDFAVGKYIDGIYEFPYGKGFYMLRSFFFFTFTEGAMIKSYGFDSIFNPSIVKVSGLNTVIFPWHLLSDFGVLGLFFFSLLFGLATGFFYCNTIRKPNLFRLSTWGIIIGIIFFSFLIPAWEFWFTYVTIFIFAAAHGRIRLFLPPKKNIS